MMLLRDFMLFNPNCFYDYQVKVIHMSLNKNSFNFKKEKLKLAIVSLAQVDCSQVQLLL